MPEIKELRMQAYYFRFSETGVRVVDEILSAIACAGKGYHHTDEWAHNECSDLGLSFPTEGDSYAEVIQHAAHEASEHIRVLEAQIRVLQGAITIEASNHGVTNLRGPLVLKHGPLCVGCQQVAETVRKAKADSV